MRKISTLIISLLFHYVVYSQSTCDALVPSITIDLSGDPNAEFITPLLGRDGVCCSTSTNCVEFVITLHPDAIGVIFDIYSGAVPPGALYYQIDCGPQTFVGESICLNDTGPHYLTFCKPGGNSNEFIITSLSSPTVSNEITINEGCNGQLEAFDFDESTITWNSIYPGVLGNYNGFLDCTAGCSLVNVSATGAYPDYVDYEVCGSPTGGCTGVIICETVRVYFNSTLGVILNADPQVICYGEAGSTISAMPTGGTAPYSYLWNTGATTQIINVPTGGSYSVTITDASGCPGITSNITVSEVTLAPAIDAGIDQSVCIDLLPVQLNASYSNLDGIIWSSGGGVFSDINNVNSTYSPTSTEIENGFVTLSIEGFYNNGCPSVFDDINISLVDFTASVDITTSDITCFGYANGEASVSVVGLNGPYNILWSTGDASVNSINDLSPGNYEVSVTNSVGCVETYSYSIVEPDELMLSTVNVEDISCFGLTDGSIIVSTTGGTGSYNYTINGLETSYISNNLGEDSYDIIVTDQNGCSALVNEQIIEPDSLNMTFTITDVSCYNLADGVVEVQVNGGVGQYTCTSMMYDASGYGMIGNLASGSYNIYAEDENGCSISRGVFVDQPAELVSEIINSDTICPGSPIVLTANTSGGTMPYTFNWSNSSISSATVSVIPSTSEQFSVEIIDDNGCRSSAFSEYYVPILNPNDLHLSSENEICLGNEVQIVSNYSGNNYPISVAWNNSFSGLGTFSDTPAFSSEYIVEITDKCDNYISKSVNVLVRDLPQVNLPSLIAEGCPPLTVDFSEIIQFSDVAEFNWEFGNGAISIEENPIITFYEEGDISVNLEVVDIYGCANDSKGSSEISIYPAPNASPRAPIVKVDEYNPIVQFYNESIGYSDFTWSFGDETYSKENNPVHEFRSHGTYEVELFTENELGCIDKKSLIVEVEPVSNVYIPNAFSPNGDGKNDEFNIEGYNLVDDGYELSIYNRWGELIFRSESRTEGWKGLYNNQIVPQGNYVYKVRVKDVLGKNQEYTGSIAVVR